MSKNTLTTIFCKILYSPVWLFLYILSILLYFKEIAFDGLKSWSNFKRELAWYMKYKVLPDIYKSYTSNSTYTVTFSEIYPYRFKIARYIANYYSGITSNNWIYNPVVLDRWKLKAIFNNAVNKSIVNSIISYFTDYFTVLKKLYKFNKKYRNDKLKIVVC